LDIISIGITDKYNIEALTIDVKQCAITSIYKTFDGSFEFKAPKNYKKKKTKTVINFNSHKGIYREQ